MNTSHLLWQMRILIITVLGFFLSTLTIILSLPFIIIFWVISETAYLMIRIKLGNTFTRPNGMDILQGIESERSRPFINIVARFEGDVDVYKFCRKFDEQILTLKDKKGRPRFKRFHQVFENIYGYHVFKDAENFNVDNHIKKVKIQELFLEKFTDTDEDYSNSLHSKGKPTSLDGTATSELKSVTETENNEDGNLPSIEWEKVVEKLMEKYGSRPISPGCPQWEILLVEEQKHYTVLFRMHHSFCDGVYFLRFLLKHVGDRPVECKLPYNYHQPNPTMRFMERFWAFCLIPYAIFRLSFSYEENPLHGPKLSGEKMFLISKPIPLETFKEIKKESKTSMNSIIFTCMSNAVAFHFQKKNSTAENIIVLVPMSMQDLERPIKLKNRFAMIGIKLPTFLDKHDLAGNGRSLSSALDRLREVQASCDRSKSDPSFLAIHSLLLFACPLIPTRLMSAILKTKGLTTSMSNVVGPQDEEFYFTGARKTEIVFWIPDRSPLGMGVSVAGFAGKIRVGLMVDKTLMKTKEEGYDFLDAFVQEIKNLTAEVLSEKRLSNGAALKESVFVKNLRHEKETEFINLDSETYKNLSIEDLP